MFRFFIVISLASALLGVVTGIRMPFIKQRLALEELSSRLTPNEICSITINSQLPFVWNEQKVIDLNNPIEDGLDCVLELLVSDFISEERARLSQERTPILCNEAQITYRYRAYADAVTHFIYTREFPKARQYASSALALRRLCMSDDVPKQSAFTEKICRYHFACPEICFAQELNAIGWYNESIGLLQSLPEECLQIEGNKWCAFDYWQEVLTESYLAENRAGDAKRLLERQFPQVPQKQLNAYRNFGLGLAYMENGDLEKGRCHLLMHFRYWGNHNVLEPLLMALPGKDERDSLALARKLKFELEKQSDDHSSISNLETLGHIMRKSARQKAGDFLSSYVNDIRTGSKLSQ